MRHQYGLSELSTAGSDWRTRAACRGMETEAFFPPGLELHRSMSPAVESAVAFLRTVCEPCPVRAECLADSIERGDQFGVFGGLTPTERKAGQRIIPPNHQRPWADEDLALLRHLHEQGLDDGQIGDKLGRTARSVREQRRELRRGQEAYA